MERQYERHPPGSDKGGEFAPKHGPKASATPKPQKASEPPKEDNRSVLEPMRFLGTAGEVAGMQAAWDLTDKVLPKVNPRASAETTLGRAKATAAFAAKKVSRVGVGIVAGGVGSMVGGMVGREGAQNLYAAAGKEAPEAYTPPERSGAETAWRIGGGIVGWSIGNAVGRTYFGKMATAVLGSMAGEEISAFVHQNIVGHFGDRAAIRVANALKLG